MRGDQAVHLVRKAVGMGIHKAPGEVGGRAEMLPVDDVSNPTDGLGYQ